MAFQNIPIVSECFARIEYDDETEELVMTFQKGGSYTIQGIPQIEVSRWTESVSVGGYFNNFVRGKY